MRKRRVTAELELDVLITQQIQGRQRKTSPDYLTHATHARSATKEPFGGGPTTLQAFLILF